MTFPMILQFAPVVEASIKAPLLACKQSCLVFLSHALAYGRRNSTQKEFLKQEQSHTTYWLPSFIYEQLKDN